MRYTATHHYIQVILYHVNVNTGIYCAMQFIYLLIRPHQRRTYGGYRSAKIKNGACHVNVTWLVSCMHAKRGTVLYPHVYVPNVFVGFSCAALFHDPPTKLFYSTSAVCLQVRIPLLCIYLAHSFHILHLNEGWALLLMILVIYTHDTRKLLRNIAVGLFTHSPLTTADPQLIGRGESCPLLALYQVVGGPRMPAVAEEDRCLFFPLK